MSKFLSDKSCKRCGGVGKEFDGKAIETTIQASGIKPNDLAKKLKITPQYLCDLRKGRHRWRAETVEKLVKILKPIDVT